MEGSDLLGDPRVARVREALAGVSGAWLVGGAVRDLLLGREVVDVDVVVEGDGIAAARRAARTLGGEVRAHGRFATATVAAPDGFAFDVVSARAEAYPAPGALPEVRPGTLEDDLARRDFTVNAIALSLSDARLREFPGARADLEARRLRVLHEGSFRDDPTRLLRLARYAGRLEFAIEPDTEALAREALDSGALDTVSRPRIGADLLALCADAGAVAALERAREIGLDAALHPRFRPRPDLAHAALAQGEGARGELVVLATCLTGFSEGELHAWLAGLGLTAAGAAAVEAAALGSAALAERLLRAGRPSEVRRLLLARPPEQVAVAAALDAAQVVERWRREWSRVALEIDGRDLVGEGVPEGPAVGRGLEAAWAAALDEGVRDRAGQLAAALRAARGE